MSRILAILRKLLLLIVFVIQAWILVLLLMVNCTDKLGLLVSISRDNLTGKTANEVSAALGAPNYIVYNTSLNDKRDSGTGVGIKWIYSVDPSHSLSELIVDFDNGRVSRVSYSLFPISASSVIMPFILFGLASVSLCLLAGKQSEKVSSLIKSVLLIQVELIASPFPLYPLLVLITFALWIASAYYYINAVLSQDISRNPA